MPKKIKLTCVEVDGSYGNPNPLYSVDLTATEIRGLKAFPSNVSYPMSSLRGDESPLMGAGFSGCVDNFCGHLEKQLPNLKAGLGSRLCNQAEKPGDMRQLLHSNHGLFRRLFGMLRAANEIPEATLAGMEAADRVEAEAAARQAAAQQAAARQAAAQQEAARKKAARKKAAELKAAELKAAEEKAAELKAAEQVSTQAEQAADTSQTLGESLKSLELILKYGFDELTSEASVVSQLTDPSITPATRLLILDLIYVMAAHFPQLSYSRHAAPGEQALWCIQQFSLTEDRYHVPLIRMAGRVNHAGILQADEGARALDTDFALDNPALEVANDALRYLKEKASTFSGKHNGFFTHATEATASLRAKDADFESGAADIEAHAGQINPLDLPPEVLEKLQAQKQLHETVTAQPTMF
jgi:hypothetical protein